MLRDQKLRRFDTVTAWWDDLLRIGIFEAEPFSWAWQWGEAIPNRELWKLYEAHRGSTRGVSGSSVLIRELRALCTFGNEKSMQRRISGQKEYVTLLPTLGEARKDFCNKLDDPHWFDDELVHDNEEDDDDEENKEP